MWVKANYSNECHKNMIAKPGRVITTEVIASLLAKAWPVSFTPVQAFEKVVHFLSILVKLQIAKWLHQKSFIRDLQTQKYHTSLCRPLLLKQVLQFLLRPLHLLDLHSLSFPNNKVSIWARLWSRLWIMAVKFVDWHFTIILLNLHGYAVMTVYKGMILGALD